METILLVEEDPGSLVALSLLLHCFGYTVLEAGSRAEAWTACEAHGGRIHLIVIRAILKDDNAGELISWLQLRHQIGAALLLSSSSDAESDGGPSTPCECRVLEMPFQVDALSDALRGLLDR